MENVFIPLLRKGIFRYDGMIKNNNNFRHRHVVSFERLNKVFVFVYLFFSITPEYGSEQSQLFVFPCCTRVFQPLVVTCSKSLDNGVSCQMWRGFKKRSIQSFALTFTLFLPDWETLCWELGAGNDWVGIFNIFRKLRRQPHSQRNPSQPTIIPPKKSNYTWEGHCDFVLLAVSGTRSFLVKTCLAKLYWAMRSTG